MSAANFVKLVFADDIRRVACSGVKSLTDACKQIWALDAPRLTYHDEDGDRVTVGSDGELREAVAMGISRFHVEGNAAGAAVVVAECDDESFVAVEAEAEPEPEPAVAEPEVKAEPAEVEIEVEVEEEEDHGEATEEEVEVEEEQPEELVPAEEELKDEDEADSVDVSTVARLAKVLSGMGVSVESIGDEQEVEEDRASVASSVHRRIRCDGCGVGPIEGARFKCTACPDFDLCAACESQDVHDPTHDLLKIRLPEESKMERTLLRLLKRQAKAGKAAKAEESEEDRAARKAEKAARCAARRAAREAKKAERAERRKRKVLRWDAMFVEDVTIPDGLEVQAGAVLVKTWRIRNTGAQAWENVALVPARRGSVNMTAEAAALPLLSAGSGEEVEVTVTIRAPEAAGTCRGVYRLLKPNGKAFGCRVWVELNVVAAPAAAAATAAEEVQVDAAVDQAEEVKEEEPVAPVVAVAAPVPAAVEFEGKWAKELRALHDMGFTDKDLNESLLAYTRGNLNKVLAHLLKIQQA